MRRSLLTLIVALHPLSACDEGASDPGLHAAMHVRGAKFVRGELRCERAGPDVASVQLPHQQVLPGEREELLHGALGEGATALLLALADDAGYWIVPAAPASIEEPLLPTFRAELAFASTLAPGPLVLTLCAANGAGQIGNRQTRTLEAALRWRDEALDLSWFVTAGELTTRRGALHELVANNHWRAPREAGAVHLWVVVRDERGASNVLEHELVVTTPQ